jgi:hypothetical protein
VILARKAPLAVIFRRGPSDWFQLIRWETDRDIFQPGQWFHGKIDATRSDLSPSGDRLIYFACGHKRRNVEGGYACTWTAISRPPYFTALTLWPNGDTWFGGGLFDDEKTVRLNQPGCRTEAHPSHPVPKALRVVADPMYFWERTPFSERLKRDGWTLLATVKTGIAGAHPQKWERADRTRRRSLLLLDMNDGLDERRSFHYAVVYRKRGEEILGFEAEWADWDQTGRLAYASGGKLWRVDFGRRGRYDVREIADFNAAQPDPQPSPAWARR